VQNGYKNELPTYAFADPTGIRDIVADGAFHELKIQNGEGQYSARCENRQLLVEAHAPNGEIYHERYYIERAALVRIRLSQNQPPAVLSCAPTRGTLGNLSTLNYKCLTLQSCVVTKANFAIAVLVLPSIWKAARSSEAALVRVRHHSLSYRL